MASAMESGAIDGPRLLERERGRWSARPRAGGANPSPGVGDLERGVGKEFRVPARTVQDVVVPVAKKYQVRQRRRPVVLPDRTWCVRRTSARDGRSRGSGSDGRG